MELYSADILVALVGHSSNTDFFHKAHLPTALSCFFGTVKPVVTFRFLFQLFMPDSYACLIYSWQQHQQNCGSEPQACAKRRVKRGAHVPIGVVQLGNYDSLSLADF